MSKLDYETPAERFQQTIALTGRIRRPESDRHYERLTEIDRARSLNTNA